MNMKGIAAAIGNAASKVGFSLKKKRPEICLVSGIVGMVGTVILACIATRHVDEVVAQHQQEMAAAEGFAVNADDPRKAEIEAKAKVCVRTSWEFIKLYGPAAAMGAVSIVSLVASYKDLKKQTLVMGGLYTALDRNFREYRKRVEGELGKEKEKDIFSGNLEKVEKKETDEEIETEVPAVVSNGILSHYARPFDEMSRRWVRDAESNLLFLQSQETLFNQRLQARGHVYLNEVYEALDIPPSQAGHHVGWIFDENNPNGDNYISFDIFRSKAFIDGDEPATWLDFNVDGVIDADPRVYKYKI